MIRKLFIDKKALIGKTNVNIEKCCCSNQTHFSGKRFHYFPQNGKDFAALRKVIKNQSQKFESDSLPVQQVSPICLMSVPEISSFYFRLPSFGRSSNCVVQLPLCQVQRWTIYTSNRRHGSNKIGSR